MTEQAPQVSGVPAPPPLHHLQLNQDHKLHNNPNRDRK